MRANLDAVTIRWIAFGAEVAEKTLRRALAGKPIRSLSRMRIKRHLESIGRSDLLPAVEERT